MTPQDVLNDYGHCTTVDKARLIIMSHSGKSRMDNGAIVLRYIWENEDRRVNPIFVSEVGWLVPISEIKP